MLIKFDGLGEAIGYCLINNLNPITSVRFAGGIDQIDYFYIEVPDKKDEEEVADDEI